MWCRLKRELLDNFLEKYPRLEKWKDEIILLESSDYVYFPRLMGREYSELEVVKPETLSWKDASFKFESELRDVQKDIVKQVLGWWQHAELPCGIIEAPPGTGKTVLGIYLASLVNKVTCVIVDNTTIAKQWIDEFLRFTNLTKDDIELVKAKYPTPGKKVYVALVQTLLSKLKREPNKIRKAIKDCGIGFVIYDEVHRIATGVKYAKVSLLFDTPFFIGLSATPFSRDVHEFLMYNTIGPVIATGGRMIGCLLRRIFYSSGLTEKLNHILYYQDFNARKARYNSLLADSLRNQLLVTDQCKRLLEEGHKVIVIVVTVNHVKTLVNILSSNLGITVYPMYSETKRPPDDAKLIVSTYAMGSHGFNMPSLSAIVLPILLAGKVSIKQSVGRVLREYKGKNQAIIVDLEDTDIQKPFKRLLLSKKKVLDTHLPIKQKEFYTAIIDERKKKIDYKLIKREETE